MDPYRFVQTAIENAEERTRTLRRLERRLRQTRGSISRTRLPMERCEVSIEPLFMGLTWRLKEGPVTYYIAVYLYPTQTLRRWIWGKAISGNPDASEHEIREQKTVPSALIAFVKDHPILTHEVSNAA